MKKKLICIVTVLCILIGACIVIYYNSSKEDSETTIYTYEENGLGTDENINSTSYAPVEE